MGDGVEILIYCVIIGRGYLCYTVHFACEPASIFQQFMARLGSSVVSICYMTLEVVLEKCVAW